MSTQKTDTQQAQFAPAGMSAYNAMMGPGTGGGGGFMGQGGGGVGGGGGAPGFMGGGKFGGGAPSFMQQPGAGGQQQQGGFGNVVANYINNPFSNPYFQTQQQLGTRQAQNLGGTQMSDLMRNMISSGMQGGASSPAGLEMQQNQARANTGLQANLGFLQPVQNALGMQQGAMNIAAGFHPLQTGQTQTEKTSGLGTWLPQMLGAGLGFATGGGLGQLGHLFGGGGGPANSPYFQAQNPSLFGQMPQQGGGFAGTTSGMGGWQGPSGGFQMPQLYGGAPPPPMPGIFGEG